MTVTGAQVRNVFSNQGAKVSPTSFAPSQTCFVVQPGPVQEEFRSLGPKGLLPFAPSPSHPRKFPFFGPLFQAPWFVALVKSMGGLTKSPAARWSYTAAAAFSKRYPLFGRLQRDWCENVLAQIIPFLHKLQVHE